MLSSRVSDEEVSAYQELMLDKGAELSNLMGYT